MAVPCLADTPNDPNEQPVFRSGRLKIKLRALNRICVGPLTSCSWHPPTCAASATGWLGLQPDGPQIA